VGCVDAVDEVLDAADQVGAPDRRDGVGLMLSSSDLCVGDGRGRTNRD